MLAVLLLVCRVSYVVIDRVVLPQRMHDLMLHADDAEIPVRFQNWVTHSQYPEDAIAKSLASEREAIVLAAFNELADTIDRMENSPSPYFQQDLFQLIVAIQNEFHQYSPTVRSKVADVLRPLVGWNWSPDFRHRNQILLSLEEILEAGAIEPVSSLAASDQMHASFLQGSDRPEDPSNLSRPRPMTRKVKLKSQLPVSPVSVSSNSLKVEPNSPQYIDPMPASGAPEKLPDTLGVPRSTTFNGVSARVDLSAYATQDLMWLLHHAAETFSDAAMRELAGRGFGSEEISLAKRLANPNIRIRLDLVRDLPSLRPVDANVWLYYMTKDPDETVRYAASAALLTSSNPTILKKIRADLATDPSPRVRSLVKP